MDIAPLKLQIRRPKRDAVSYPLATYRGSKPPRTTVHGAMCNGVHNNIIAMRNSLIDGW